MNIVGGHYLLLFFYDCPPRPLALALQCTCTNNVKIDLVHEMEKERKAFFFFFAQIAKVEVQNKTCYQSLQLL